PERQKLPALAIPHDTTTQQPALLVHSDLAQCRLVAQWKRFEPGAWRRHGHGVVRFVLSHAVAAKGFYCGVSENTRVIRNHCMYRVQYVQQPIIDAVIPARTHTKPEHAPSFIVFPNLGKRGTDPGNVHWEVSRISVLRISVIKSINITVFMPRFLRRALPFLPVVIIPGSIEEQTYVQRHLTSCRTTLLRYYLHNLERRNVAFNRGRLCGTVATSFHGAHGSLTSVHCL